MVTRTVRLGAIVSDFERQAWEWFVGLGAIFVLLGIIASMNLVMATVTVTFVVGAMMFAGGILQLIHAVAVRRWTWVILWGLSGLLYLAAAGVVIYDPFLAAVILTLLLSISLGASGLIRIFIAIGDRRRGWGWMLASGLVSCAVAIVIGLGWPVNALWMLGLILAVDLLFQGMMLLLVGFSLRSAVRAFPPAVRTFP